MFPRICQPLVVIDHGLLTGSAVVAVLKGLKITVFIGFPCNKRR